MGRVIDENTKELITVITVTFFDIIALFVVIGLGIGAVVGIPVWIVMKILGY